MGKARLKPQIAAKYSEELANAEKMAQAGFDPKTKKLDENIYGPTNIAFNPLEEMQILKDNMITDDSFLEASKQEFKSMNNPNMVNDALDAIQAEDQDFPMVESTSTPTAPQAVPEASQVAPASTKELKVKEEGPTIPEDPEERLVWVAEQLATLKPDAPSADMLREWKRIHGNVFVLQIDEHVFIYRYLKRQEWAQIQANESFHTLRSDQQEDHIAVRCTLWPKFNPHTKGGLPAGAVSMLAEQIRIQSMFLDPMQVANITIKL